MKWEAVVLLGLCGSVAMGCVQAGKPRPGDGRWPHGVEHVKTVVVAAFLGWLVYRLGVS